MFQRYSRHRNITTTYLTYGQLQSDAHFANDLGLDSLDTVEVVMAIEEVRGSK